MSLFFYLITYLHKIKSFEITIQIKKNPKLIKVNFRTWDPNPLI